LNDLKGAHVLVTRPAHQAENLSNLITRRGGIAIRFPTLEVVAAGDSGNIRNILANPDRFQWLVFISANAVNFALKANGGKIDRMRPVRIAAIGRATAQALDNAGLPADLVPEDGFNSEALLSMPQMRLQTGQRCLIVRGQGGREELADALRNNGVDVEYLEVYKRIIPDIDKSQVELLLADNKLEFITITSGEALQNLLVMVDKAYHQALFAISLVVISDRIRILASRMGFNRITVTDNPSDAAILDTVTTIIKMGESGRSE